MPLDYADIRLALRGKVLDLLGDAFPLQIEGRAFSRQVGQSYIREILKPSQGRLTTIGAHGRVRHTAVYLLDCFTPANKGSAEGDQRADALVALFYPGLHVGTAGGQKATVRASYRVDGRDEPDWRMVPVTIELQIDTLNPQ